MSNIMSQVCTALTTGYVPAALDVCGKTVGFLADKIISVTNTNTDLTLWQADKNDKALGFPVEDQGLNFLNVAVIATPVILSTILLLKYICSVSSRNYDEALRSAHLSGADVHDPMRQDATFFAIHRLFDTSPFLTDREVKRNLEEFTSYLEAYALKERASVIKAKQTLGMIPLPDDSAPVSSFPPLFTYSALLFGKIPRSGEALVAQIWYFIKNYSPDDAHGDPGLIMKERDNCRVSFVNALGRGMEDNDRICDHGVCQHIVTAVLQGRLPGVEVGDVHIAQLLTYFLQRNDVQWITTTTVLMKVARDFLSATENITIENKVIFMKGIRDYAHITYDE